MKQSYVKTEQNERTKATVARLADVNITISLSEKGDLLRFQSGDVDQRIDHFCRLFSVACAEVNDVVIRRMIAQDWTTRIRSEKQDPLIFGQRNGDDGCRGADIADDGEHVIFFNQLQHIGSCAR